MGVSNLNGLDEPSSKVGTYDPETNGREKTGGRKWTEKKRKGILSWRQGGGDPSTVDDGGVEVEKGPQTRWYRNLSDISPWIGVWKE